MSAQMVTRAPCGKCPFRKDVPIYLRRGRRIEIAASIAGGASFPCHEHGTVVVGTDEADSECTLCGEPVCTNCADKHGRCGMCTEEEPPE